MEQLIINRTRQDVARGNDRGTYGVTDVNRVERAVKELAEAVTGLQEELSAYAEALGVGWADLFGPPYDPGGLTIETKTDWGTLDIPMIQDMDRYLGNVAALCDYVGCSKAELPKTMEFLTWTGANAIERALLQVRNVLEKVRSERKQLIENTADAWVYAGEIEAGGI